MLDYLKKKWQQNCKILDREEAEFEKFYNQPIRSREQLSLIIDKDLTELNKYLAKGLQVTSSSGSEGRWLVTLSEPKSSDSDLTGYSPIYPMC